MERLVVSVFVCRVCRPKEEDETLYERVIPPKLESKKTLGDKISFSCF